MGRGRAGRLLAIARAEFLRTSCGRCCEGPGRTTSPVPSVVQGLFFRLFYPCVPRDGAERPLWIPRYEYCSGLADFSGHSRRWCAPLLSIAIGEGRPYPHPHAGVSVSSTPAAFVGLRSTHRALV